MSGFRESEFIAWATEGQGLALPVGPGDDAAQLADGSLIALDTVVEGVHFRSDADLADVADKAIGACVSDLCAMGGEADAVLVSAQLPPGCDGKALALGLRAAAARHGVALIGGDTVATRPGALALAVTARGPCHGKVWTRSGGRPGDRLVVSGPLGGSRSGRHLHPVPRRDLVARLRADGTDVHACMDLSDGLGRDLPRLCAASGVGAVVEAEAVPVHDDVPADTERLAAALGDGEDFELLLALPAGSTVPDGCVIVGELRADPGLVLRRGGRDHPWPELGFEHVF